MTTTPRRERLGEVLGGTERKTMSKHTPPDEIEAIASADHESRHYDPNNAPTFAWSGQSLHYMGGECEEVRFDSGKTLLYLFNPQRPRTGGVCPARDNAQMLAMEIVKRWNAHRDLLDAAIDIIRRVDLDHTEPVEFARCVFDDLRAAIAKATGE